jgi:hypothetical protein
MGMLTVQTYRKLRQLVPDWRAEDQEDLATADSWGALALLPKRLFLVPLLRQIRRVADGAALPEGALAAIERDLDRPTEDGTVKAAEFRFWPSYAAAEDFPDGFAWTREPDGGRSEIRAVEPDVVIDTGPLMVFIEAKFRGSSLGSDISQTPRQLWTAHKLTSHRPGLRFIVLCVTLSRSPPPVVRPVLSADRKAIVASGDRSLRADEQVAEYLRLAAGLLRPDLAEASRTLAATAADHVYHVGWRTIAGVFERGLAELTALAPSIKVEPNSVADMAAGIRRLAQEAVRALVDLRGLRPFGGFADIGRCEVSPGMTERGFLFLDCKGFDTGGQAR